MYVDDMDMSPAKDLFGNLVCAKTNGSVSYWQFHGKVWCASNDIITEGFHMVSHFLGFFLLEKDTNFGCESIFVCIVCMCPFFTVVLLKCKHSRIWKGQSQWGAGTFNRREDIVWYCVSKTWFHANQGSILNACRILVYTTRLDLEQLSSRRCQNSNMFWPKMSPALPDAREDVSGAKELSTSIRSTRCRVMENMRFRPTCKACYCFTQICKRGCSYRIAVPPQDQDALRIRVFKANAIHAKSSIAWNTLKNMKNVTCSQLPCCFCCWNFQKTDSKTGTNAFWETWWSISPIDGLFFSVNCVCVCFFESKLLSNTMEWDHEKSPLLRSPSSIGSVRRAAWIHGLGPGSWDFFDGLSHAIIMFFFNVLANTENSNSETETKWNQGWSPFCSDITSSSDMKQTAWSYFHRNEENPSASCPLTVCPAFSYELEYEATCPVGVEYVEHAETVAGALRFGLEFSSSEDFNSMIREERRTVVFFRWYYCLLGLKTSYLHKKHQKAILAQYDIICSFTNNVLSWPCLLMCQKQSLWMAEAAWMPIARRRWHGKETKRNMVCTLAWLVCWFCTFFSSYNYNILSIFLWQHSWQLKLCAWAPHELKDIVQFQVFKQDFLGLDSWKFE